MIQYRFVKTENGEQVDIYGPSHILGGDLPPKICDGPNVSNGKITPRKWR